MPADCRQISLRAGISLPLNVVCVRRFGKVTSQCAEHTNWTQTYLATSVLSDPRPGR